jgi:hypothetical protein
MLVPDIRDRLRSDIVYFELEALKTESEKNEQYATKVTTRRPQKAHHISFTSDEEDGENGEHGEDTEMSLADTVDTR